MKQALEEHEQVKHLGMVQEVTSPRLGKQRLVGQPIIMSRTPSKIVRADARSAATIPRRSSPKSDSIPKPCSA